jgi:hypothetical protein
VSLWLRTGTSARFCDHNNELLGYIQYSEFLELAEQQIGFLKETLLHGVTYFLQIEHTLIHPTFNIPEHKPIFRSIKVMAQLFLNSLIQR